MRSFTWVATLFGVVAASGAMALTPPLFTLRPVIGAVEDRFGSDLAVTRDQVLVASFLEDTTGAASFYDLGAGAGYLLDAATGTLLDTLVPAPREADANAGRAVAVTRTRLLVGGSDWSGIGLVGVWARKR